MQTNVNWLNRLLQSCCVVLINIIQVSSMEGAEPVSSKKPADVSRPVAIAVTRALPFLWQEGERWIEERGCVSCHQVPLMIWSLSAALESGFSVSKKRLQNHKEWSVRPASFVGPEGEEPYQLASALTGNTDMSFMGVKSGKRCSLKPCSIIKGRMDFGTPVGNCPHRSARLRKPIG